MREIPVFPFSENIFMQRKIHQTGINAYKEVMSCKFQLTSGATSGMEFEVKKLAT